MKTTVLKWFGLAVVCLAATALRAGDTTSEVPTSSFEKECHGIVMSMERDIAIKDSTFFDRIFDLESCLDRSLRGLDAPNELESAFRRGARESFKSAFSKTLLNASSVRYLRMRHEGKEPRFLFRMAPKEGGVNYFELIFEQTRRNGVKAVDIFQYSLGQTVTYTFRHAFLPICREADRGWFEKLNKKDAEFLKHFEDLSKMMTFNARGRYAETLNLYAKLPDSVQKEKLFLIPQMQAAVHANPRSLDAAIDLWRGAYPGEASVDLVAANFHLTRRNYEPAFAALARFDKALGGDAFIDVLRGQQYKNQSKWEEARTAARAAVTRNPKLSEGWELLISVGLSTRNYPEVAQALTEWESKTRVEILRVAQGEKFYDFARSTAGKQWFAHHDVKNPPSSTPVANAQSKTTPAPTGSTSAAPTTFNGSLKLQGIIFSSNPSAIISGQTVFVGDRVAGGYRVEKITQRSVMLKSPTGEMEELTR